MSTLLESVLLRWLVATISFPLGGALGHVVAGPADTLTSGLISGLLAGAVIGLGQGLALGLGPTRLVAWIVATALGLGVGLGAVAAAIDQIATTGEAVGLGAVCGILIGIAQATVLRRRGSSASWLWIAATAIAWAAGWLVTASIGVSLAPGWAVYGMAGAITSQVITALFLWRLGFRRVAAY